MSGPEEKNIINVIVHIYRVFWHKKIVWIVGFWKRKSQPKWDINHRCPYDSCAVTIGVYGCVGAIDALGSQHFATLHPLIGNKLQARVGSEPEVTIAGAIRITRRRCSKVRRAEIVIANSAPIRLTMLFDRRSIVITRKNNTFRVFFAVLRTDSWLFQWKYFLDQSECNTQLWRHKTFQ